MNTHPDYPQRRLPEKRMSGLETRTTPNGLVVGWQHYDGVKLELQIEHPGLTADERDAVLAFESANLLVPFYFQWHRDPPDTPRTVRYVVRDAGSAPVQVKPLPGNRYDVSYSLRDA